MSKDTIVLHHTADQQESHQYAKIVPYHKLKFGDFSYHYLIERDGTRVQGREEIATAYHSGNYFINQRSIGVCLAGDFTKQVPSAQQISTLVELITDLQMRYGIPDNRILLHREAVPNHTQCPAIDLRAIYLEKRKERLNKRLELVERALKGTKEGPRKNMLERTVKRLKAMSADIC